MTRLLPFQVANLSAKGLKTCCVTGGQLENAEAVVAGEYQLLLFTPEMMIEHKRWRKMLLGEVYTSRLRAFVVDLQNELETIQIVSGNNFGLRLRTFLSRTLNFFFFTRAK